MNFFNLNNNLEPDTMLIESHYEDKMKVNNPAPMAFFNPPKISMESGYQYHMKIDASAPTTVFGNCKMPETQDDYNSEDEYSIVENFEDTDLKDVVRSMLSEGDKDYTKCIINQNDKDLMRGMMIEDNKNYMKGIMNEDEKDQAKDKPLCNVNDCAVVVEKLSDSVVQQFLAKKPKNCVTMSPRQSLSKTSILRSVRKENHKADSRVAIPVLRQYLSKKQNIEADEFVKELRKPIMQQYLANTEMGCLTDHFMEPIPESKVCPARSNDCTTDNLIENIFGTDEIQYPAKIERNDQIDNYPQQYSAEMEKSFKADNFMKNLSYPAVQQRNIDLSSLNVQQHYVDVEKVGDFIQNPANIMGQENSVKKQTIRKIKRNSKFKQSRKNSTTNLCKRICPNCQTYVQEAHKAVAKVKCCKCEEITWFECNKCKKQAQSYYRMVHHLSHYCEARTMRKCAHCQYSVKRKHTLAIHIKRKHAKIMSNNFISQSKCKNGGKSRNESNQGLMNNRRYENLIVLKKQKEMACKSEWYIEKVKRSDPRVDKSVDSPVSSVPPKPNSTPLVPNPTSVKEMSQLFCEYCETKIAVNGSCTQSEIICRVCGSTLLFKCSKCQSTCESYVSMKNHLKKDCTLKENRKSTDRKKFYCTECNYRSFFQGLVNNHQNKVHSIHKEQEFSFNNLIRNCSKEDSDFYLSEQEMREF